MRILATLMIVFLFAAQTAAQDYWKWSPDSVHHDSIVRVLTPRGYGTGCIIEKDLVLTAYHVIDGLEYAEGKVSIKFANLLIPIIDSETSVISFDKDLDVALIKCDTMNLAPFKVSEGKVSGGEKLELCGYGAGSTIFSDLRHFYGNTNDFASNDTFLCVIAPLLPGDSGGPILNADHELVSINSHGKGWYDNRPVLNDDSIVVKPTWPAMGPQPELLQKFISERPEKPKLQHYAKK